jgi:hypothetical protein
VSAQEAPPELIDRLVDDFPGSPLPQIEELVGKGWSRTDPGAPIAHRIAVTERFARLALREDD